MANLNEAIGQGGLGFKNVGGKLDPLLGSGEALNPIGAINAGLGKDISDKLGEIADEKLTKLPKDIQALSAITAITDMDKILQQIAQTKGMPSIAQSFTLNMVSK